MHKTLLVDPLDFEDLMRHCFDIPDDDDVGEFLELRSFADGAATVCHELVSLLLPMAHIANSPLSGKTYQSFCRREGTNLVALVKREIE